jgi:hypothetical protein
MYCPQPIARGKYLQGVDDDWFLAALLALLIGRGGQHVKGYDRRAWPGDDRWRVRVYLREDVEQWQPQ